MTKNLFRPFIVFPLLALLFSLWVTVSTQNPLALVTLGTKFAPTELSPFTYSDEGYDGQFVYYVARYGWEADAYLDVSAYRTQRILLPWVGRVIALGQVDWLVGALLFVNIGVMSASIFCFEQLLTNKRNARWYVIGYALSLGVLGGVRLTTTEPLAYGLVVISIALLEHKRDLWGMVLLGLSALAKEMTLIFVMAYGVYWLAQRDWRKTLLTGFFGVVPFVVWQGVLFAQFGTFGIGSGGALATSFEIIPLMGFLRILTEGGIPIFLVMLPIVGIFVLLPTLWGLWQCYQDKTWTIWTFLLFFNAFLLLFVPFSTYREILGILRFIVGLQIAVILYANHKRQRRILLYSTLWLVTSLFVIVAV